MKISEEIIRKLVRAAMRILHHDIDDSEIEAQHEIAILTRDFKRILKFKEPK